MKMNGNTKTLPILEPLSRATASQLKAVKLDRHDYLEVDLDKEGRRFVVEAAQYKVNLEYLFIEKLDSYASGNAMWKWVQRIPEHHRPNHFPQGKWILAGTDFTALVVFHQWPENRIVWLSEDAKTLYQYLLSRFLMQTKNSIVGAAFKVNKVVPEMPDDYIEHPELPLTDYQKVGLSMSLGKESFSLFMQQGTGKTPLAIARICLEGMRTRAGKFGKKRMMRTLIICPRQARANWQNEIERFTVVPAKISVARGGLYRRIKAIVDAVREEKDCVFGACIMSYESIENTWEAVGKVPWDLVVMDESHYIKNQGTKRFQSAKKLRDISYRRMILTGTPITNTPMDLWSQFEFLDDGLSGFMSFKNYRRFYGKFEKMKGQSVERLTGLKNIPLMQERLTRLCFSITKKEADLNLPEKTFDLYEVQMTKVQAEAYKTLQTQLAFELEQSKYDKTLTADHILTRLLRLAQITSGHIKWDDDVDEDGNVIKRGPVEQINGDGKNPKVEALIDMIREDADSDVNSKMIVWACFIEDIRVITKRLHEEGIGFVAYHKVAHKSTRVKDAEIAADVFNNDKDVKVLVANPASAAEALNLLGYNWQERDESKQYKTYCGHEVFFSQNWSPVQRSQAEDRAHRRGTRKNVRITDLMVVGTIDEEIRMRVVLKRRMAMAIQDVRGIMERVLNANIDD